MNWRPSSDFRDSLFESANRLRAAHFDLKTSNGRAFQVVREWLTWTIDVDEQLWKRGRGRYEEERESFTAGKALPGLRHVNNVIKHQGHNLHRAVELVDGMAFPAVFPAVFREIAWVPLERLPPIEIKYRNRRKPMQESAYQVWLAGHPVRELASPITEFLVNIALPADSSPSA